MVLLGVHEAIITMKDNNMTSKIRLYPDHAFSVIETLFADSDALCGSYFIDYDFTFIHLVKLLMTLLS